MEIGAVLGIIVLWVVGSAALHFIGPATMSAPDRGEARRLWRERRAAWGMATKIGTALLAGAIVSSVLAGMAGAVLTAVLVFRGS